MGVASAATGVQALATGAKIVALGAEALGVASTVTGVASQIAATVFDQQSQDLTVYVDTLPECNTTFTGTVTVSGGGVNVTGASIFNEDVGVAADVNVEGNVNASQVYATQGISALGGGIWIGDPNGTTYSDGITVGGGALSGAGEGGAQAFTGDVNAIAIGNNAQAMLSGSLALGLDASSTAVDAIAIGNAAVANGVQDVVVGALNNTGAGGNNTVVGNEIDIIGATSASNTVLGVGHQVTGSGNFVGGDPITVVGSNNVAIGNNGNVTGDSNVAIGDTVNITGDRAIAIGDNATANADDTTVVGTNAQANAAGSAAYGQGAVATLTQQAGLRYAVQYLHNAWYHVKPEQGPPDWSDRTRYFGYSRQLGYGRRSGLRHLEQKSGRYCNRHGYGESITQCRRDLRHCDSLGQVRTFRGYCRCSYGCCQQRCLWGGRASCNHRQYRHQLKGAELWWP